MTVLGFLVHTELLALPSSVHGVLGPIAAAQEGIQELHSSPHSLCLTMLTAPSVLQAQP